MPCLLQVDGGSTRFLQALDQLLQAHAADLGCRLKAPRLRIPTTPRDVWDLPAGSNVALRKTQPSEPASPSYYAKKTQRSEPTQPRAQEVMQFDVLVDGDSAASQDAIVIDEDGLSGDRLPIENPSIGHCGTVSHPSESSRKKNPSENDFSEVARFGSKGVASVGSGFFEDMKRRSSVVTEIVLGNQVFRMQSVKPGGFQDKLRKLVGHGCFSGFFSILITLNCITMGLQAEQVVKNKHISDSAETFLSASEHVFTAFFTAELMVKFAAYGCHAFSPSFPDGRWNIADIFLVLVTGVLFTWILPILSTLFHFDNESGVLRALTIFRSVRLLRLVRVLQRIPQFREAWLLLRGLLDSARVLFWTVVVIMFITYIFAILGLSTVTKELAKRRDEAELTGDAQKQADMAELLEFIGGLDTLMYTLIQLLTLDSWNGIVRRIVKELNWAWIFFYAYIAVAVFVLMNLVTAIIVDSALSQSKHDETETLKRIQKQEKSELKQLEHLFELMDADESGTLSWDEFKAAFEDPTMKKKWKLLDFEPEECKELWGLLDNGDGEIETHEFFQGLGKMKGSAQSKDIFRVHREVELLRKSLEHSGLLSPKVPSSPKLGPKKRFFT